MSLLKLRGLFLTALAEQSDRKKFSWISEICAQCEWVYPAQQRVRKRKDGALVSTLGDESTYMMLPAAIEIREPSVAELMLSL